MSVMSLRLDLGGGADGCVVSQLDISLVCGASLTCEFLASLTLLDANFL